MKQGIRSHFKKAFSEPDFHKPTLEYVSFKVFSFEDNSKLEIPFSYMEIKTIVWDYEVSKSPGLDDYNFYFIGKCWDFLKVDIIMFVKEFHGKSKLNKSITSSFLTLVPKSRILKAFKILDIFG